MSAPRLGRSPELTSPARSGRISVTWQQHSNGSTDHMKNFEYYVNTTLYNILWIQCESIWILLWIYIMMIVSDTFMIVSLYDIVWYSMILYGIIRDHSRDYKKNDVFGSCCRLLRQDSPDQGAVHGVAFLSCSKLYPLLNFKNQNRSSLMFKAESLDWQQTCCNSSIRVRLGWTTAHSVFFQTSVFLWILCAQKCLPGSVQTWRFGRLLEWFGRILFGYLWFSIAFGRRFRSGSMSDVPCDHSLPPWNFCSKRCLRYQNLETRSRDLLPRWLLQPLDALQSAKGARGRVRNDQKWSEMVRNGQKGWQGSCNQLYCRCKCPRYLDLEGWFHGARQHPRLWVSLSDVIMSCYSWWSQWGHEVCRAWWASVQDGYYDLEVKKMAVATKMRPRREPPQARSHIFLGQKVTSCQR